jgi:rubrerythrin
MEVLDMDITTKEVLKKKILDAQEMVRDYEVYSKKINDSEIADLFKNYAEECGIQAANLMKILNNKYEDKNNNKN